MGKQIFRQAVVFCCVLFLSGLLNGCTSHKFEPDEETLWTPSEMAQYFGDDDPWEGFNRSMFEVNRFGMMYVVRPLGWIYGSVFPRPVIKHIGMFSENLAFPARMFSAMCQNKWKDSGVVFLRFLTNTTIGIGGFFDPAEHWFDLYPRKESFCQAFEHWGIPAGNTLILPFCAGTNVRDCAGTLFDTAFDIKTYLPYGVSTLSGVNKAVDSYRPFRRLVRANQDPYELFKEFDLLNRRLLQEDWELNKRLAADEMREKMKNAPAAEGKNPVENALPAVNSDGIKGRIVRLDGYNPENVYADSVRASMFKPQSDETSWWTQLSLWNTDFTEKTEYRHIPAHRAGAEALEYSFWRSPLKDKYNKAPLVFVLPGIGSHHTNPAAVALAEVLNHQGYAVVLLSNAFCWDFYRSRHTGKLPGYTPDDAELTRRAMRDVLAELAGTDEDERFVPEKTDVVGYSMGGLYALHIADSESRKNTLGLNRITAINPPVDMLQALRAVDECGMVAKGWSREKMARVIPDGFGLAMAAGSAPHPHVNPLVPVDTELIDKPPRHADYDYRTFLSEEQARFMIGMSFRYTLRDVLLQAVRDRRVNPLPGGVNYNWSERTGIYKLLDRISFEEYMNRWLLPSFGGRFTAESIRRYSGLKAVEQTLLNCRNITVMHNLNDFLLSRQDREWLDRTMGDRIVWFDNGGHLGNLYYGDLHRELLKSLTQ